MNNERKSKGLKAVQLIAIPHPEGVGFAILSDKGVVYTKVEGGWLADDMKELKDDSPV